MAKDSIKDVSLTSEEVRIVRQALVEFIVNENCAVTFLRNNGCEHMANSVAADTRTAAQVLKFL